MVEKKEVVNEYFPDYITPPGESLLDTIEALGLSQADLARLIDYTPKGVNEIIKGKSSISSDLAIKLERVLNVPATFWNNRQRRFDEFMAEQRESKALQEDTEWIRNFPIREMIRNKWIPEANSKIDSLKNLLNFFGVASPAIWRSEWSPSGISFRKSSTYEANKYNLAVWLRRGELIGRSIDCAPYNEKEFKKALEEIRKLTIEPQSVFVNELVSKCAACGVAVVFVKELPKTASGAMRWLTPDKALIQLSLRYKTDDHLWFTFFHEAAHVLSSKKRTIFLDSSAQSDNNNEERFADNFATRFLISEKMWSNFPTSGGISKKTIRQFANDIGIAPGIVAGQLQKQGRIPYSHFNDLKRKLDWVS